MDDLALKIRISMLWIFMAVSMSACAILEFMRPGGLEMALAEIGAMGPGMVLFAALFWWVPLVMAVLSTSLKGSANRWTNIVLGIIFTVINIIHLAEHAIIGLSVNQMLFLPSVVVITALIVWSAWKLPKHTA